jgi:hypothetical protein
MPKSVMWFEILSYLALLLGTVGALAYPENSRQLPITGVWPGLGHTAARAL